MDAVQESLNKMMDTFNCRLDTIEEQVKRTAPSSPGSLADELASLRAFCAASMRALQTQIAVLALQVDQGETRSRRKILLVHGVQESQKEDTAAAVAKVMVDKLKQAIFTTSNISRCHRMGRVTNKDRPRPILVKLRDVGLRDRILSSKTSLKSSGVTISEFLTKTRHDAFLAARQRFGVSGAWTREGVVYVLGQDGERHRIYCMADLAAISHKESEPAPAAKETPPKAMAVKTGAAGAKPKRVAASRK